MLNFVYFHMLVGWLVLISPCPSWLDRWTYGTSSKINVLFLNQKAILKDQQMFLSSVHCEQWYIGSSSNIVSFSVFVIIYYWLSFLCVHPGWTDEKWHFPKHKLKKYLKINKCFLFSVHLGWTQWNENQQTNIGTWTKLKKWVPSYLST